MANPITPTPELHGQVALDFITEIEKNVKASEEEKKRVKEEAEIVKSWLTFNF
ncbi:MAG: hypothetical protein MJZ30_12590 [Paludibacteraceae bacterium]|nr:hypothetical protein [Paludibacteraceae bacterium]